MYFTRFKRSNGLGRVAAVNAGALAAHREQTATVRNTTGLRAATVALGVVLGALGCGGRHGDTYAKATNAQEACCENLTGDARAACLQKIVRVDDPKVAASKVNQDTYGCVVEHFTCDAATGVATKASAQAQLECIQDLQK
ncbi:MAG TPA: hypothetical protein PLF40_33505 [Kofleriaceae bacterium]|nr:hypothetical protein [Kofleriaceae bacterium]